MNYRREELSDSVAITMQSIPAGSFLMGSPETELNRSVNEGPLHSVNLEAFELSTTVVTQAQWAEIASWPKVNQELDLDPSGCKGSNRPVERVTWDEAVEFCARLSAYTSKSYTLPSEAQWEYACRAGTTKPYNFGLTGCDQITPQDCNLGIYTYNYAEEAWVNPNPEVGSFPANAWGLYDMHGNVWEWCLDDWHSSYYGAPEDGAAWLKPTNSISDHKWKVVRGGVWKAKDVFDRILDGRSAFRVPSMAEWKRVSVSFRVCCN
jgi:formylglycine-generating enzyme required for sulfatase activity